MITEEVARKAKCSICGASLWDENGYFRLRSYWLSAGSGTTTGPVDLRWYHYNGTCGINCCGACASKILSVLEAKGVRVNEVSPA